VLFDGKGKEDNQFIGKSPNLQTVIVDDMSEDILGQTLNVKIDRATQNALYGRVLA
jgi:tRNA A37 methylthiotransferase MiaB